MKPQETKFEFVYNEIKQRILCGQILPGNSLPSSRMLCDQFHVSRYTTNRVFETLREEGLIEIRPRLAPIVAPRMDEAPNLLDTVSDILAQKNNILQVYQTFAIVMPPLLVFATQNCDLEIMPHYKQAMKVTRLGLAAGGWRPPSDLVYDILKCGGNTLFSELYTTFDLYNKLTFFTEECPYFRENFLQVSASITGAFIDILKGKEPAIKYGQLSNMYQNFAGSIASTLNYLSETVLELPVQTNVPFAWNPMRGQDFYHAKIVDDLNRKIGTGEYTIGMYLPYEKQLARHYGVSLSTIRKALSELEQRGFVKTLNGKGTVVIKPDDTKISQLIFNAGYTEKALRYLHSLQLLVLLMYPAALAAAPRFTREELNELSDKFTIPGPIFLADVFLSIIKHTTLKPLAVILTEASHLADWGHYFTYYLTRKQTLPYLNQQAASAVQQLREGDAESFARTVTDCYRYVLIRARKYMLEKLKFIKATFIRIPETYYVQEPEPRLAGHSTPIKTSCSTAHSPKIPSES